MNREDILSLASSLELNAQSAPGHKPLLVEISPSKLDKAAAMLREYAEGVEGWRPIETAPEDGTPILIASLDDEGTVFDVLHGHFEVLAEDEEDGPWDIRDGEPWCSYVGREKGIYFCHWLPCKEWESRWMFGPNTGYTHWCRPPLTAALSGRTDCGCTGELHYQCKEDKK